MLAEEEQVRELVRQMYEKSEHSPWSVSAEDIRSQRRLRTIQMPSPKLLVLIAAAALLVAVVVGVSLGSRKDRHPVAVAPTSTTLPSSTTTTSGGSSRVAVPNIVGLGQVQAVSELRNTGLSVGQVDAVPSRQVAGTVVSENPAPGAFVVPGSSVDIGVSSGSSAAAAARAAAEAAARAAAARAAAASASAPNSTLSSMAATDG